MILKHGDEKDTQNQISLKNKERKMKLSFGDMEATTRITKSRDY